MRSAAVGVGLLLAMQAGPACGHPASREVEIARVRSLFGRPVIRDAFHFQISFGVGGGPDTAGVFHAMEIGGTFDNGLTLALLHTFIQNRGVFGTSVGEPDLIGGWMAELKYPIIFQDVVGKVAAGWGGTHEQEDGIKANGGLAWSYGVDIHFPLFRRSGATLSVLALQVLSQGRHHFGLSTGLGYTFF